MGEVLMVTAACANIALESAIAEMAGRIVDFALPGAARSSEQYQQLHGSIRQV